MCVTATAKRRRRQAKNNNNHVAKLGRRVYNKKDPLKAAERLRRMVLNEQLRRQRKGNKK